MPDPTRYAETCRTVRHGLWFIVAMSMIATAVYYTHWLDQEPTPCGEIEP